MRRRRALVAACLATVLAAAACGGDAAPVRRVVVGATTSIQDSGLLDAIDSAFSASYPDIRLQVISAGTGEVIAMATRGDVDAVITHDSAAEAAFIDSGRGMDRRPVMRDAFIVVGPASDPAGLAGSADAATAFRRVADHRATFVSRGDDSGTHTREMAIWRSAGLDPDTFPRGQGAWYVSAGAGMAEALRIAVDRQGYVLTDRPTWKQQVGDRLPILVSDDPALRNDYAVTRVRGAADSAAAAAFADWITSPVGQAVIGGFGRDSRGHPLFEPTAGPGTRARPT